MSLKKFLKKAVLAVLAVSVLSGCSNVHTSKSLTFQVETGDKVEVKLDTTDGYSLSQKDGKILINKDDQMILQGTFLTMDGYNETLKTIQTTDGVTITEGTQDDNDYIAYDYTYDGGAETGFLVKVKDANCGVFLQSKQTLQDAQAAFSKLQFVISK